MKRYLSLILVLLAVALVVIWKFQKSPQSKQPALAGDKSSSVGPAADHLDSAGLSAAAANWEDESGRTALVTLPDGRKVVVPEVAIPANGAAQYARTYVDPLAYVKVEVYLPEIPKKGAGSITALDGGVLDGSAGEQSVAMTAGETKKVQFGFTAGQYQGLHRVLLNFGVVQKQFTFWVGPDLPVVDRNQPQPSGS